MRTAARQALLVLALWLLVSGLIQAAEPPEPEYASTQETNRSSTVRAVYFPFLAIGHGVWLVVRYGVGYPVYFFLKPAVDFLYSSSEDPADFPNSRR
jgi:hypothetical protein